MLLPFIYNASRYIFWLSIAEATPTALQASTMLRLKVWLSSYCFILKFHSLLASAPAWTKFLGAMLPPCCSFWIVGLFD